MVPIRLHWWMPTKLAVDVFEAAQFTVIFETRIGDGIGPRLGRWGGIRVYGFYREQIHGETSCLIKAANKGREWRGLPVRRREHDGGSNGRPVTRLRVAIVTGTVNWI